MSAFFTLELDITSPTLEIISPSWTTADNDLGFDIVCNDDELDPLYQDIKFIDSHGREHLIIAAWEGDGRFHGLFDTWDVIVGVGTLVVTLSDEVGNTTTIQKNINILPKTELKAEIDIIVRKPIISYLCRNTDISVFGT